MAVAAEGCDMRGKPKRKEVVVLRRNFLVNENHLLPNTQAKYILRLPHTPSQTNHPNTQTHSHKFSLENIMNIYILPPQRLTI